MTKTCLNTRGCYGKKTVHLEFYDSQSLSIYGKFIKTDNFCSKRCYDVYNGYLKPEPPEEKKMGGVKKGTKRGKYRTKKRAIKGSKEITLICKLCGRTETYIRIGKRLREFCGNACKQKYYRQQKIKREMERKKSLF